MYLFVYSSLGLLGMALGWVTVCFTCLLILFAPVVDYLKYVLWEDHKRGDQKYMMLSRASGQKEITVTSGPICPTSVPTLLLASHMAESKEELRYSNL